MGNQEEAQQLLPWTEEQGEKSDPAHERVLTVSEANRLAKSALEKLTVAVQGEISRLTTGYAYYVYFDLRDSEASLPAVMTQQQFKSLDFEVGDGASVVVDGTLSLYERQGKYQIRVRQIRPAGEGELQRKIEALKKKLQAEGLFGDDRKVPLPAFPEKIGVVTSPRGAAIRDVIVTLGRRFPPANVYVKGVTVQGATAVEEICSALEFFDSVLGVDLVILARGGGSLQDLEPFNSEEVARAISSMATPVVTGIGHEPDVTIADLVADRRASTPTGAAEAAVPDRSDVQAVLSKTASALKRGASSRLISEARRIDGLVRRPVYRGADFLLGPFMQRWEKAAAALPGSPQRGLQRAVNRLSQVLTRPVFKQPAVLMGRWGMEVESVGSGLVQSVVRVLERWMNSLEMIKGRVEALSPLAVMERGYSITFDRKTGKIVRSSDDVDLGAPIRVRLSKGTIDADVTGKE